MLGRLYTFCFIAIIFFSLWYQRFYLNKSAIEFYAQRDAEHSVLPMITGEGFESKTYKNSIYNSSFSGKNIVYFSNRHFEAKRNLSYKELSSSSASDDNDKNFTLNTDLADGEVQTAQPESTGVFSGQNKLKSLNLPHTVFFNLSGNIGKTKEVHIDLLKKTMETKEFIESHGPNGSIQGVGFFYNIDEGEFKILSHVNGTILLNQTSQK